MTSLDTLTEKFLFLILSMFYNKKLFTLGNVFL